MPDNDSLHSREVLMYPTATVHVGTLPPSTTTATCAAIATPIITAVSASAAATTH